MNRRDFSRIFAAASVLPSPFARAALQPHPGTNLRFSVMLWTLARLAPMERAVEFVAQAGYNGVELTGEYKSWAPADFAFTLARLKSLNLVVDAVAGVKSYFADATTTDALINDVSNAITAAGRLECPQLILVSGKSSAATAPRSVQRQICVENLKRLTPLIDRANIEIVIEPIDLLENPNACLTTVDEAAAIVKAVDHPRVRILCDLYHQQRQAGNLLETLEKNIALISLIHIADVPGRHQPGTGEIRYDAIFRKLSQLNYGRFLTMEFYPTGDPVETLRTARSEVLQAGSRA